MLFVKNGLEMTCHIFSGEASRSQLELALHRRLATKEELTDCMVHWFFLPQI